jgi:protoporphyrinogen oxidase
MNGNQRRASEARPRVVIVGGGFTGLAAAYELARRNLSPTIIEAEHELGGLAGTFAVGDSRIERFYHHWFTSDHHVMNLVAELGLGDCLIPSPVATGTFYANSLFRLSSPLDLLKFTPLSLMDRLRLGMLVPAARSIQAWQELDDRSAAAWLRETCGATVYRVVWEPLLRGKFGEHAELVSAAWFWSKLRLRGGSRGRNGREQLVYFKGGFAVLADAIARTVESTGGRVVTGTKVTSIETTREGISGVRADGIFYPADAVILTTPLPEAARLLSGVASEIFVRSLERIRFLANRCLVFELDRSLSELYWINVNDASFPFVGAIEHTNFVDPANYGGRHIVYLSRYCPPGDPFLQLDLSAATAFTLPHLVRMFPQFDPAMILRAHSWQAEYAQPIVEVGYSKLVPRHEIPIKGIYLATMAQVYPEDRGTNYAIRDGRKVAGLLAQSLALE